MRRRSRLAIRPRLELLEIRTVLSALTPAQLDAAYGLSSVTFNSNGTTVKGDGTGQTIAIIDVDHDANLGTELATFDSTFSLPAASISVDDLAGPTSNTGWSEEEALDVEWAHAAAPGANILVVEAASSSMSDLINAINVARNTAGVSVVSMSWGTSEFASEANYDSLFTTPAGHTGITFLASAGDSGYGAEWPAASPNVVAVGGTSLLVDSSGDRLYETAWAGSGGGLSYVEAEPSYQSSVQSTGRRDAADVSLDADPNTGVSVYSVAGGGWIQVGGTSLSSPVWAGLIAVADEGRALSGKGSLDGATQTLADLYAAPTGSFNQVSSSTYSSTTGLGTPNAATLVAALVADPSTGAATTTTTTTGTTTTGTGTTGTTTTGTGTTPTAPTRTGRHHHPRGGWYSATGYYGSSTSGSETSWSAPSTQKNSGQSASKSTTPHASEETGSSSTVSIGTRSKTQRSIEVVHERWKRASLA